MQHNKSEETNIE